MGRRHASEEQLKQILMQAYRARKMDAVPEVDPRALMGRIRRLTASREENSLGALLDRLFWRYAPVTGAMIAILAVVALNLDFIPDADVWSILYYENEATAVMQTLFL
jgi:hypothetical protein